MNPNVGLLLHRWAKEDPKRVGIVDAGRDGLVSTYAELDRRASRLAAYLLERGVRADERVAICTANGLEFVAAWFGAVYAGCPTLPIPVASTAREIAFRLEHAKCRALLTDTAQSQVAHAGLARSGSSTALIDVQEAIENASGGIEPVDVSPEAYAMLLYTSGTTGAAKCACITHQSLREHTRALAEQTVGLDDRDRVLGTLPLTHSYGIRTTLLLPFHAGARTVFVPKFSPKRTLDACNEHHVTWLPGVPTMFVAWASEETVSMSSGSLRWCMSAGAPLSEEVRLRAERRLGAPVRQAYGLTEANLTAINAPPDRAVAGSSGRPVAGVEVRIASERGTPLAEDTRGEVLVRGPNVMAGYLDDRLATAHVLRDGWLHTGDIGFLDREGRLTIVDRSKDLILRGGASIYPSEVESVLMEHPAVSDAAVVGQPDDYYGEQVVAIVVPSGGLRGTDLDRWVRERLASYKAPRSYAFVDSLPRSSSGKTLKRLVRSQLDSGELETEELVLYRPTN